MIKYYEDNFDDDIIEAVKNNDFITLAVFYAGYAIKKLYIAIKEDHKVAKKFIENFNLEDYKISTFN